MKFKIQISLIIVLFLLNVSSYIWTFFDSFALQNKEVYGIISIFNDFIFVVCFLAGLRGLKMAKFNSSILFLSIPLIYTLFLILNFR